MAAATQSSSSSVTIQCTDVSGLFDGFKNRLEARTPLKTLHWKSPSRPLRSIPSLEVSLVRKEAPQDGSQSTARRHQLPGLRETPYVKLYLLRCDDKETYKETARKDIKQWIRENTFEKESKSVLRNQEHHDAFEWMIVHVVLPGTQASSQPQSSKHISLNDTESTDSVNSKSKWTGKATSTIYDKLRADFSSSKLAIPRVAQVRLLDPAKPPGALGPTDVEEQWRDFTDNLKASILKSFDTRVAQYEEDIKERQTQRSLPGWNFCTFFILKEGLARGFESVGLLEDALAVYSELEIGLDSLIKDSNADENEISGALLPYSSNLKTTIRQALEEEDSSFEVDGKQQLVDILLQPEGVRPFNAEKRRYREMILSNDVSPLDVRTYIFTRQLDILLRRSRIVPAESKIKLDFEVLADIADLALNFINLGSRELRMDIQTAWGGRLSGEERATQKVVISNIVASWSWAAVMQILGHLLPHVDLDLQQFDKSDDVLDEEEQLTKKTRVDQLRDDSRTSSPQGRFQTESLSSEAVNNEPAGWRRPAELRRPGLDRLCSSIAKLFLLARKTIENLPAVTAWLEEIRQINGKSTKKTQLHRLSSGFGLSTMTGNAENHLPDAVVKYRLRALDPQILKQATSSREAFHHIYNLLSKVMHHLFVRAESRHSARQVLIDLAMLAFTRGNRAFARQCIGTILGAESGEPIVTAQPHVLAMYAECLRDDNRPNDLAQCLIATLQLGEEGQFDSVTLSEELVAVSRQGTELELPLDNIANVVHVDRAISPNESTGGFTLAIVLQGKSVACLPLTEATLRLKALGQEEPQSILLKDPTEYTLMQQSQSLLFRSSVSASGWYEFGDVEFHLGNIRFTHAFTSARSSKSVAEYAPPLSSSQAEPLLLYHTNTSPQISLAQSALLDLDKTRSLSVSVDLNGLDVGACTLLIRPGTAGLRLNLLDAAVTSEDDVLLKVEHDSRGTILMLDQISRDGHVNINIPYTVESQSEPMLSLKCLLQYQLGEEAHSSYQRCSTEVRLPVSVSVQDIHRANHWYSTFLLSTATSSPIQLLSCELEENEDIAVVQPTMADESITIFAQQPARWLARLQKKSVTPKAALKLRVRYHRVDEVAWGSLRKPFIASAQHAGLDAVASVLTDHLVAVTRQRWSEEDLEMIGLTHEVVKLHRNDMSWEQVLPAFDKSMKSRINEWLTQWHADVQPVVLNFEEAPIRELRLKVDVRPPPPVIMADLQVHLSGQTAVLGQPLLCTLIVNQPRMDSVAQITYELFAPSDAWLIGGRKKGILINNEEQQSIALFPQKTGRLMLPVINIRCRKIGGNAHPGEEGAEIPVEVHNRSVARCIHVTPALQSSIIGLPQMEAVTANAGAAISGALLQFQSRPDVRIK